MRAILTGCAVLALAACQPTIPDSAAGVGFDNANLSTRPAPRNDTVIAAVPRARAVSDEPLASAPMATTPLAATPRAPAAAPAPASQEATAVAAAALGALEQTPRTAGEADAPQVRAPGQPQTTADGVVHASPSNPAPVLMNNPGISDENDFEAVGARRSIEADAARLQANRENYQVIQPTEVPKRTESGPNVVAYALSLRHPVGTKMYRRINLRPNGHAAKACAEFPSANDAQAAFLAAGGPKRDRMGIDPDGDGYACGWNPEPFRRAARGG